jgi:Xaa-Pro aminopeptidase
MTPAAIDRTQLGDALRGLGADGWLCFDFRGVNPVARRVIGFDGMVTRRVFVWLPASGTPTALVHGIDRAAVTEFDGEIEQYTTWQELHGKLERLVRGRRVAMEISPEDAVPYLDRVPAGVVQLVEALGGSVCASAPLVTRFAARWSGEEVNAHRRTAELLADIARRTLRDVVREVGTATEWAVQRRVLDALTAAGLQTDDPPIVAFGAHTADPHYAPRPEPQVLLRADDVVLLDLWARPAPDTVWADQTWMAYAGATPPDAVLQAWDSVRDARDAVVGRLHQARRGGETVTGALLDDTARGVLQARGLAGAFVHRTGHSIDVDLHGSGPHLDNFETRDVRELLPGVGFSVEPGVYFPGRFGVRSEINVALTEDGPEVTPAEPQQELIVSGE